MTATVTLPATPGPYLDPGQLPGDFYAYEDLLPKQEFELIERLREFLRTEVAPIVDDHWARAAFPFQLFEGFANLGLAAWADPASSQPTPSNLLQGITVLELAHADASVSTVLRRPYRPRDGQHPPMRLRGAAAPLAAGHEPLREDRRLRADRAARRVRRRRGLGDDRAP